MNKTHTVQVTTGYFWGNLPQGSRVTSFPHKMIFLNLKHGETCTSPTYFKNSRPLLNFSNHPLWLYKKTKGWKILLFFIPFQFILFFMLNRLIRSSIGMYCKINGKQVIEWLLLYFFYFFRSGWFRVSKNITRNHLLLICKVVQFLVFLFNLKNISLIVSFFWGQKIQNWKKMRKKRLQSKRDQFVVRSTSFFPG